MRATSLAPVIAIALGCEKQELPQPPPLPPIAIRIGDCASANVAWISGPRPMAFTLAQAEGHWPGAEVAAPSTVPDHPPPPPRAGGKHDHRIALFEDKNRKVLDKLLSSDLDLGKLTAAGALGPGTGVGTGTLRGRGGAGSAVAFADLLAADPPEPGSLAGGYWFGASSQTPSVRSGLGEALADRPGLFRPRNAGLQSPARYVPGAANPLAAHAAGLGDCLHRSSASYGAFIVELAFDPTGAGTTARTLGLGDKSASSCVTELAKAIQRPANGGPTERCSVAFGAMPLDVAHPLTLDGHALAFERKPLDFDQLRTTLETRVATAATFEAGVVNGLALELFGPIVLEPNDATPMQSIYRATNAILDAGDDFVLARHAATWKLVVPLELPVVPVPFGTGARWNRFKALPPPGANVGGRTAVVLTVQPQQITLAVGSKQTVFARDATLHDKLAAALRALKASDEFSGRADLDLAGSDDATYADLLTLVDLATATGFVDWQLVPAPAS